MANGAAMGCGSSIGGSSLTSFQSNQIFVEWPFFEAFSRFSNGMTLPLMNTAFWHIFESLLNAIGLELHPGRRTLVKFEFMIFPARASPVTSLQLGEFFTIRLQLGLKELTTIKQRQREVGLPRKIKRKMPIFDLVEEVDTAGRKRRVILDAVGTSRKKGLLPTEERDKAAPSAVNIEEEEERGVDLKTLHVGRESTAESSRVGDATEDDGADPTCYTGTASAGLKVVAELRRRVQEERSALAAAKTESILPKDAGTSEANRVSSVINSAKAASTVGRGDR
ncbi:hypothetical protein Cgig2_010045 [Carnegiea gigantea]|uniref:Uncharacterized protein n=1 Tax=Carnegiea gigantea TaxID=171969 RepID=A0A9Q1K307_9CARY|nr:hypothetical protein Cgig2_010045 [Carnegiea gigantea]